MRKPKGKPVGAVACFPRSSTRDSLSTHSSSASQSIPTSTSCDGIDTELLSISVCAELERLKVPQTVFAREVLQRSQGTLSDLLRNPKPWKCLKGGKKVYCLMNDWLQKSDDLRLAAVGMTSFLSPFVTTDNAQSAISVFHPPSTSSSPSTISISSSSALSSSTSVAHTNDILTTDLLDVTNPLSTALTSESVPMAAGNYQTMSGSILHLYGENLDFTGVDSSNESLEVDPWYNRWARVVKLSRKQYDLPSGCVGREFVDELTTEVANLTQGTYTSERLLVFCSVILQRDFSVRKAIDIRRLLKRRLTLWKQSSFDLLLQEAERCDRVLQSPRNSSNKQHDEEHLIKIFTKLLLQGKVRDAVKWVTGGHSGGVLEPHQLFTVDGTSKTVLEVLQSKHPASTIPNLSQTFQMPTELPLLADIEITSSHIERVARRLRGGAGPSGTDSTKWQDFLLNYGSHSEHLRDAVASLTRRLSNSIVEWKSIRALMASRLIALDKHPGIRPIGIGECLRRIMGKCVALETGIDAEGLCGTRQLCSGMKSGIEGAIHAVTDVYNEHKDDDWGLLLVDASNAFNSINRISALCNARVFWPRCARFLFNTYRGCSALVIQGVDTFLYSREGVTQGDPLSMLLYGVATLPLINHLSGHQQVIQNWYADDASAIGKLAHIKAWLMDLMSTGPSYGYHPEPQKSYLVVSHHLKEKAEEIFGPFGLKIVTGQRFLGGYVGDKDGKHRYMSKKIAEWCSHIDKLAVAAKTQPQCAFSALTKSLQFQWSFAQHVIPDCAEFFGPLESAITERFLPAIFGGPITNTEKDLVSLPARKGGLGIRVPSRQCNAAYNHSRDSTRIIREAITNRAEFNGLQHRSQLQTTRIQTRKAQEQMDNALLEEILNSLPPTHQRALKTIASEKASGWLTVLPLSRHNFDLSELEFRDALSIRYRRPLLKAPSHCDGCGAPFSLTHALDCKKGGMVTLRHNEIRDAFGDLAGLVWRDIKREPIVRESSDSEGIPALVADLGVRGVWQHQAEALFDIRVTDTDAQSYLSRTIPSILASAETQKKQKYHYACQQRHASFTPLVVTTEGIFGNEAKVFINRLIDQLSLKWERSHSEVAFWVRARLSFAVLRASGCCIRGSRRKWRCLGIGDDGASLSAMIP